MNSKIMSFWVNVSMGLNGFEFSKTSVIVKTLKNYENIVAQILKEIFPEAEVLAGPLNFSGLVLVKANILSENLAKEIKEGSRG